MKLKQFLASALLVCSSGAWAQTDVTSTYLTNANFESSTPIDSNLKGYGKDGTPYGFQSVDGWTSVVTSGDNSNANFPNSGMGGAVFAYGSSYQLQGNSKAAPATNPDGEASGKCFGFFGVWGCGGYYYQNVTLAAGKYTITVPMYNQSGTQANTTYTGFFPTSGTNRTVAVNPTVGQWVNQTVTFTLADATEGQIRIGYQSTGSGSGANPMLFIDCVKIEFTAIVVRDVLETAIAAATKANTALGGTLDGAIATAQGVYNNESATQEEVNAAAETLNNAVNTAMATASNIDVTDLFLTNADLSSKEEWTVNQSGSFRDQDNGLIGTYNVRFSAATVDETHLSTEYCFGFEARWSGNFASYYQTTEALPAGVYTLTYDVENVNGATSNLTYADYNYVQVGETKNYSSTTEWMAAKSSWTTHTIRVTLEEAAPITVSFGYGTGGNNTPADNTPAIYVSHVQLTYSGFLAGAKAAYDEAVANAATAKSENPNVIGSELAALNAELAKSEPTTVDGYIAATEDINDAIDELVAAAPAYNALVTEIAYAKTLNVGTDDAEAAMDSEATATTVTAATQTLKEDEYGDLLYAYPNDVTSFLGVWPAGNYGLTSGQSYQGGSETYFDTWSGSATDLTSSKTVEQLPAGKYVVRVAGRGVTSTTMNLSVKVGDAEAISTPFLMIGDAGKGIDTEGDANYGDGDYSNNNNGRGWQYRYITFTTTGEEDVTITISGHLNAGTWQSFYAPVLQCDDATYAPIALEIAKADLQTAIDDATAARKEANEGTGVFQIPAANGTALATAISDAQAVYNNASATVMEVATAQINVEAAQRTYETTLNDPEDGQLFNVVLNGNGDWAYDGKAITYIANGRNDMGNYNIQYKEAANPNLAQAFTFTKIANNVYKMSQIDADGNVRYICTGIAYTGGNASQIRTTTDAEQALPVQVIPTNIEGVWNLKNGEANQFIGSQDAGVFTVNSHINFNIVETSKPSIAINTTDAGWGTVILPFAQTLPVEGVKAYTCEAVDGNTLTLVEKEGTLEANKPYIIEGSWNEIVTGDAQGTALSYDYGLLTGVYETQDAPEGKYILQKQGEKVGFYLVDYTGWAPEAKKPVLKANRAYLTAPSAGDVKAFFFDDTTTGINAIMNEIAAGNIYDMSGRKVAKMQKGQTYIIGNKKVNVK